MACAAVSAEVTKSSSLCRFSFRFDSNVLRCARISWIARRTISFMMIPIEWPLSPPNPPMRSSPLHNNPIVPAEEDGRLAGQGVCGLRLLLLAAQHRHGIDPLRAPRGQVCRSHGGKNHGGGCQGIRHRIEPAHFEEKALYRARRGQ